MPETLGARLRQRREERGIALVTIAQQTKIKQSLLQALERDDVSQWPASVYRRAFVRAYARAIDLDPEKVVHEFLQAHPDPPEVDVLAAMASTLDRSDGVPRRSNGFRRVVGSAFESLSRRQRSTVVDDRVTHSGAVSPAIHAAPDAPPVATGSAPIPAGAESTAVKAPPEAGADSVPIVPPSSGPDLLAVARLCTEFGRVETLTDVEPLLEEAAGLLEAKGLIVWLWDASSAHLQPALVHGYPDKVVSQLPMVRHDADNLTAAAFRAAETRVVADGRHPYGALVVPLLTAAGCAGVLAIELQRGREETPASVALATILAAHLAQMPGRGLRAAFAPRPRRAAGTVSKAV